MVSVVPIAVELLQSLRQVFQQLLLLLKDFLPFAALDAEKTHADDGFAMVCGHSALKREPEGEPSQDL